jgi:flavodoxin
MNIKVVYYSETGNTKKIADAIAESVGVIAEPITDGTVISDVDLLFVGGFLKAFTLVSPTKKLLKTLKDPSMAKYVAVFSTSASGNGILKYAKKLVTSSIPVFEDDFKCKGSYRNSNPGKPDETDCEHAKQFAKNALEQCNGVK